MTTPTDELRAAAARARKIGDLLYTALADWLDAAAVGYDATVKGAAGVWTDPADAAERDAWVARQTDQHALAVARQVLGTPTTDPAPTAPLAEVWAVWREDEPIWAHFATVDDARQGTIDLWQEDEPACPDYSWDRQADGKRLELLVGGEHSGVYASRYRVHGAPASAPAAPANRATVLREAADEIAGIDFHPNARARSLDIATGLVRRLRRLADEAQPTEAHPAEHTWAAELHDPLANEWVPGTRYRVRDRALNALEHAQKIGPAWKDGTPTERRLVRATTTYTVEPATAATEEPQP